MENLYAMGYKYEAAEVESYYVDFLIIRDNYIRFFEVIERLLNYGIMDKNLIKWDNNRVRRVMNKKSSLIL